MNTAQDQINVLSLRPRNNLQVLPVASNESIRKPLDPRNGHEAILRTMIKKKAEMVLVLNDGTSVFGRISQFDNFTITIYPEDNGGMPETFFKHAIRSFTQASSPVRED